MRNKLKLLAVMIVAVSFAFAAFAGDEDTGQRWKMDKPMTTFWGWPYTTPEMAQLMADGGCNYIFSGGSKAELDAAQAKGLRVIIGGHYPGGSGLYYLLDSSDEEQIAAIDALMPGSDHPAVHGWFIMDEPTIEQVPKLGRLIDNFRSRDPGKLFFVNIGGIWDYKDVPDQAVVDRYKEFLQAYMMEVQPDLLCYDEYPFYAGGKDEEAYFLSLALTRQAALSADIPFKVVHQACDWNGSVRVPNENEMRWQYYTSLAYGAQAMSYFIFDSGGSWPGCMVDGEGETTPGYAAARELNPQFITVASQLQPLHSLHAYHAGTVPWGGDPLEELPADAPFYLDFSAEGMSEMPLAGMLLGYFGEADNPTHVLVVNPDYNQAVTTTVMGPSPLSLFDAITGEWTSTTNSSVVVTLPPGGGQLIRIVPEPSSIVLLTSALLSLARIIHLKL